MKKAKNILPVVATKKQKLLSTKKMVEFAKQFVKAYYGENGLKQQRVHGVYYFEPNTSPQIYLNNDYFKSSLPDTVARVGHSTKSIQISSKAERNKGMNQQKLTVLLIWGYENIKASHDYYKTDANTIKTVLKRKLATMGELLEVFDYLTEFRTTLNEQRSEKIRKIIEGILTTKAEHKKLSAEQNQFIKPQLYRWEVRKKEGPSGHYVPLFKTEEYSTVSLDKIKTMRKELKKKFPAPKYKVDEWEIKKQYTVREL